MTRIAGYSLNATRCCGARFRVPLYASTNYSSAERWTDGYRERSLMPVDHDLRRCRCGEFFIEDELILVGDADNADAPLAPRVPPSDLSLAISSASRSTVELAARLDLWHQLNHSYRAEYRAHRDAEEAASEAAWEAANPDQRTETEKLDRFIDRRPRYTPSGDRLITFPSFSPTQEQRENMTRLLRLLEAKGAARWLDRYVPEIYRELGRFDEATEALQRLDTRELRTFCEVLGSLIKNQKTAPVRYRNSYSEM